MQRWLSLLPPWERVKPLLLPGSAGLGALIWVIAFVLGSKNSAWDSDWTPPTAMRGKTVIIADRSIETPEERAKREAKALKDTGLKDEMGDVKKKLLGDQHKLRGDVIRPEKEPPPPGMDFTPREACIQMKLQYPERFTDVDCMSDLYDSRE